MMHIRSPQMSSSIIEQHIKYVINKSHEIQAFAASRGCGSDDVSFRGSREFLTPNIDAMAYHGKILNRFYTPPVCTPSRSSLMTGLYPIRTGSQYFVLKNNEPWDILENHNTMADIFKNHGYSTNLVGKWHLGNGRKDFTPTFKGFDYHYGYWGGFIDYYRKRSQMPDSNIGYDFRRNLDILCTPKDSYATDLFTEEAERIISMNNGSQPLFLLVSHLAPHTGNFDDLMQAPQEEIEKFSYIPDKQRQMYAAMVSKLDESIGRIIHALDQAQMLENSIVLFYSDNGAPTMGLFNNTGSNWPLRGQKDSPWEGGIRVPAVIWSPFIKNRASINEEPIYVGDLLPTLASAANIKLNENLDGINMWSDLAETDEIPRWPRKYREREILHVLDDIRNCTSYMRGQYKYIKGTTLDGLYDEVLYQRNPNVIDPREFTYEQTIRSSLAFQSLRKYDLKPLTLGKMLKLRKQSGLVCRKPGTACNPLEEECLFNIWLDPCEQNNLARNPKFAKILTTMRQKVELLRNNAVEPKTGSGLTEYDPTRHNCIWSNFLEEQPTDYTLHFFTLACVCPTMLSINVDGYSDNCVDDSNIRAAWPSGYQKSAEK
ncbi:arylsulfatase B-like [Haematobia irritans]|uniref:arylsulfatase B-like n=1 Tax=Haematobia irritans TaxID=7368 RepID=UPI003F50BD74